MGDSGCCVVPAGTSAVESLRSKQKDASESHADVELALLELCALIPLSSEAIWEGAPELFPVLFQFKESFERLSDAAPDPQTSNVLTLHLRPSEFGVSQRRFRVNCRLTAADVVALLCRRLGVAAPERYALASLRGFRFGRTEPLVCYGFGVLFRAWELCVVRAPSDDGDCATAAAALLLTPPPTSAASSTASAPPSETVVLHFPPLLDLAGLHRKTVRLAAAELHMPIALVLARLWARLGVQRPAPASLTLVALPPANAGATPGPALVLAPQRTLHDYGLGWRFHGWALRVEFASLAGGTAGTRAAPAHYPWVAVPAAHATPDELRACCTALDSRLTACERENAALRDELRRLRAQLQAHDTRAGAESSGHSGRDGSGTRTETGADEYAVLARSIRSHTDRILQTRTAQQERRPREPHLAEKAAGMYQTLSARFITDSTAESL